MPAASPLRAEQGRSLAAWRFRRSGLSCWGSRMNVQGFCGPAWGAVAEEFARNFAERGEVGAAVCVIVEGETVADLWGGVADRRSGGPWQRDTIGLLWSCTKGAVALCTHVLVARGQLDLDAPVARYWPE